MAKYVFKEKTWDGLEVIVEGNDGDPEKLLEQTRTIKIEKQKEKEVDFRRYLAAAIAVALVIALALSGLWGWLYADFGGLREVWAVGSLPLGGVVGHYFAKHDN